MRKLFGIILVVYMVIMGCSGNTTSNNSGSKSIDELYVDSKRVDCVGVAPQKCLRTRTDPNGEWQFFYDTIEGFDYQEGFTYKLKVNTFNVENPPADASSIRYELDEVISKTAVENNQE